MIIFLPVVGGIVYILTQMVQKREVEQIQKELTSVINPTKKINDLKAQLEFADTFQNRVNLADALLEQGNYQEAIDHYRDALSGNFSNDVYVKIQLIRAFHQHGESQWIIQEAESIKAHPDFMKSAASFYYGLALDANGNSEAAQAYFDNIDRRYSNYPERVKLASHYSNKGNTEKAIEILDEVLAEGATMGQDSSKLHRTALAEARKLRGSL
ncbi:tetratricopeptide repeat protein [Gilvibacter sediminis]|uniref:tetratricopeptide repeat protein n=1 Tax=Gilvibacter sediminis TaxID=379071 RepID=UPI002350FA63|nr:tetratricopeptide repeat protein [Gilvibacter sediminis]MDC7998516.1 tetratricopeptide repeat protein [Gilvibacter sediminis]